MRGTGSESHFALILRAEVRWQSSAPCVGAVFVPRRHHKDLVEFARSLTVAEQPSLSGSGPKPGLTNAGHRLQKVSLTRALSQPSLLSRLIEG
jgi:hypothetical protein